MISYVMQKEKRKYIKDGSRRFGSEVVLRIWIHRASILYLTPLVPSKNTEERNTGHSLQRY